MAAGPTSRRSLAAILFVIAAAVSIAAVFCPWYALTVKIGGETIETQYYPGAPSAGGTVQCTSTGSPGGNSSTSIGCASTRTSYSAISADHVGTLAEAVFALAALGGVFAALAGILGWLWRRNPRRTMLVAVCTVVALASGLIAFVGYAAEMPTASADDYLGSGPGPWSSFSGSYSNSTTAGSLAWGPAIGWYLPALAVGLLAVGLWLLILSRERGTVAGRSAAEGLPSGRSSPPTRVRIPRPPH